MLVCPYCGSSQLKTVGGEYGNPFDRCRERTVCLDCGRNLTAIPKIPNIKKAKGKTDCRKTSIEDVEIEK